MCTVTEDTFLIGQLSFSTMAAAGYEASLIFRLLWTSMCSLSTPPKMSNVYYGLDRLNVRLVIEVHSIGSNALHLHDWQQTKPTFLIRTTTARWIGLVDERYLNCTQCVSTGRSSSALLNAGALWPLRVRHVNSPITSEPRLRPGTLVTDFPKLRHPVGTALPATQEHSASPRTSQASHRNRPISAFGRRTGRISFHLSFLRLIKLRIGNLLRVRDRSILLSILLSTFKLSSASLSSLTSSS